MNENILLLTWTAGNCRCVILDKNKYDNKLLYEIGVCFSLSLRGVSIEFYFVGIQIPHRVMSTNYISIFSTRDMDNGHWISPVD